MMIKNNDELRVVRKQLVRVQSALESLHKDVLPKSATMYQVMSEPCVEMITKLQDEIDAYLSEDR